MVDRVIEGKQRVNEERTTNKGRSAGKGTSWDKKWWKMEKLKDTKRKEGGEKKQIKYENK